MCVCIGTPLLVTAIAKAGTKSNKGQTLTSILEASGNQDIVTTDAAIFTPNRDLKMGHDLLLPES